MGLFNDPNDPGGCVQKSLVVGCLVVIVVAGAAIYALVKAFA